MSASTSRPSSSGLDAVDMSAAALACLPDMTAARLRALLERWRGPVAALAAIRRGLATVTLLAHARPDQVHDRVALARLWQADAASDRVLRTLGARHTRVFVTGRAGYPIAEEESGRPAVLLAEGDRPDVLARPRVAIVGTRAATPHGLADARETGAVLAEAGVTVVSGMAIGIDGAAHEGALDAGGGAVGVLATGLDVVYPRRHGALFERVRASGLLVSELGYGVQPRAAAFPVRNRIIALLADVVVVIEATLRGGARITAERALEYGRPVLAVPGSRRNHAAEGTNALIADGAHPLLHPSDVLLAIGLTPGSRRPTRPTPDAGTAPARVLAACGGEAATFDQLASRTGLAADQVAVAVRELERSGWMERAQGLCWPLTGER
jgi:DNA processing protein